MKLISLQLCNFRQFYDKTPIIEFASKAKKNVTVIHAENGAGKTALLNALTWVLYEKHTAGFLYPEEKVNRRAIHEAKPDTHVEAWVELKFEHDDFKYALKRKTVVYKETEDRWNGVAYNNPTLIVTRTNGTSEPLADVKDVIGRILPEDLHYYFFFDGERIEKIVNPDNIARSELGKATKKLLGLKVIERAIEHLDNARRTFEQELKAVGDPETQKLLEEKEQQESQLNAIDFELKAIYSNLDALKLIKNEIEERLRNNKAAKEFQDKRDKLNQRMDEIIINRDSDKKNLQKAIFEKSYFLFLDNQINAFNTIITEKEAKGDLPSKYKKQFIIDLLEQQKCICGRDLDMNKNRESYEKVKAWLEKAGLDGVDETVYTLRADINGIPAKVKEFWKTLQSYQNHEEPFRTEKSQIESALEEIKDKLHKCTQENVADLENQLTKTEVDIDKNKEETGKTKQRIEDTKKNIKELENKIKEHESKEDKQELIKRRIDAAHKTKEYFESIYKNVNHQLRARLQEKINTIFQKISVKNYTVELNEEFELSLYDQTYIVAQSQGESQILSLSFIAGIIELVREGIKDDYQNIITKDSKYPIIMDSPFGALDPTNRRRVTEQINTIADQVVILVSGSQWRNEVEEVSQKNIGKSYILKYHTPKKNFKQKVEIVINQRNYDLVVKSHDEHEHTEIIEVDDE